MSATGKAEAGFTLLETLVVLGITALLSGLGYPAMQRMIAGQTVRTTTRELVLALRETRAMAVRGGEAARFDVLDNGRVLAVNGQRRAPLPEPLSVVAVDTPTIRFYADGTSSGGRLRLVGSKSDVGMTVFPSTGLVVVGPLQ